MIRFLLRQKQGASLVLVLCFAVLFLGLGGAAMTASASALQTSGIRSAEQCSAFTAENCVDVVKCALEQENSAMMNALEQVLFRIYASNSGSSDKVSVPMEGFQPLLGDSGSGQIQVVVQIDPSGIQAIPIGAEQEKIQLLSDFSVEVFVEIPDVLDHSTKMNVQLLCSYSGGTWTKQGDGSYSQTQKGFFSVSGVRKGGS